MATTDVMEHDVETDEQYTGAKLPLNISYPNNPDYEYQTRLIRLNLDKERESDLLNDRGFIVAPTQGIKKDLKNEFSIFSPKFGRTLKDVHPLGNRYKCDCGFTFQKINDGTVCKVCGTKVKFVDDDYQYFGWIVLKDYYIISPAYYKSIEFYIGKDFGKIIKMQRTTDEDGHQITIEPSPSAPYNGYGMVKFVNHFDEIMDFYHTKNKGKKEDYYEDIMSGRDKIFTQSVPVFTALLRPFDAEKNTLSYETTNAVYTSINKYVSVLNSNGGIEQIDKEKSVDPEEVRKVTDNCLENLQYKVMKLYDSVIEIISGKKGTIRSLFGGRYNFSSRNVITANPQLRIDEVKLPYSALIELLKGSIINILHKSYNMSYFDAYTTWYKANIKKSPVIINIINTIITESTATGRGLPVIINRNPTINFGSILQCFCVGISDPGEKFQYVMQVPLQILRTLAADFDGDVLNLLYIINQDFFEAAYRVFNPRNNLYISHNDGMFNSLVNQQRDTLINANTMVELGRQYYTPEEQTAINAVRAVCDY